MTVHDRSWVHPAFLAWLRVDADGAEPDRIEVLKEKARSSVYRLVGVGQGRSSVIAKRQCRREGEIERLMYAETLPRLGVSVAGYHGFTEEAATSGGRFSWLFVEDLGNGQFSPGDDKQRRLVAGWLAEFHSAAADTRPDVVDRVIDRGPDKYAGHLRSIRRTVARLFATIPLEAKDKTVLGDVVSFCDRVEAHWDRVERFCRRMPRTLVHGDCLEKNLHIKKAGDHAVIVPIDWASVGWGLPGADLGQSALAMPDSPQTEPDHATYLAGVRQRWPDLDLDDIRRMATLGKLFWCVYVIDVAVEKLTYPRANVDRLIGSLRVYETVAADSVPSVEWKE